MNESGILFTVRWLDAIYDLYCVIAIKSELNWNNNNELNEKKGAYGQVEIVSYSNIYSYAVEWCDLYRFALKVQKSHKKQRIHSNGSLRRKMMRKSNELNESSK